MTETNGIVWVLGEELFRRPVYGRLSPMGVVRDNPQFPPAMRGGGLGSRPVFKKFHETYAPS